MALAVSDMEIYQHLTPQVLAQRQTLLERQSGGGAGHQPSRREHPIFGGPLHRAPILPTRYPLPKQ
ncbi:MAG: hypothetical protein ACLU38_01485 [Dysosmobacter sp.]